MREKILESLQQKGDLPPLPKVLLALQKLKNDPDCNVDDISRLIKADMVLTGKLVTLSNNVFFSGGRDKAEDIEEAIVRLGIKMVLDLCYSVEVPKSFSKIKSFDQTQFWKHSLAVGYLTRMLANELLEDPASLEASFLAGLMHDVGILVFDYLVPDEYFAFLHKKDISGSGQPLEALEMETFGINHQELGALFLKKWWELPPIVTDSVTTHHEDYTDGNKKITLVEVLSAANKLANENEISHPVVTKYKEITSEEFMKKSGLSQEQLDMFIDQTKIGLLAFDCLFEG
ncbi:MAG: HDOD domain-containing protein [Nitrospina sp.]|jgi:HD-like signal output (HDOD) protein|nr:HDOD domain-containing protein [Nitrospina sp.]MBT6716220.1 HDOD domain-containing protein [Nitrospina sp.]